MGWNLNNGPYYSIGYMTNQKPIISIIVPIFNVAQYLQRSVSSMMNQTMKEDIEFIFVEDCSTDNSFEVLQNLLQLYPERQECCVVHRFEKNRGVSAARNKGIEIAQGEWIAFADPDDELVAFFAEHLCSLVSEDVDLVYAGYNEISIDEHLIKGSESKDIKIYTKRNGLKEILMPSNHYSEAYIWNKLYRKNVIIENNLKFIETQILSQDRPFTIDFICHSKQDKIIHSSVPIYNYYRRGNSSTAEKKFYKKKRLSQLDAYIQTRNILESYYGSDSELIDIGNRKIYMVFDITNNLMTKYRVYDPLFDLQLLNLVRKSTKISFYSRRFRSLLYLIFRRYLLACIPAKLKMDI